MARGKTPLLPVEEARQRILDPLRVTSHERVTLRESLGRILAEDVIARRTQPPADMSAMDGYAVRAADVTAAGARLHVIGEAPAGRAYAGEVKAGETVRIFTGGALPAGTDSIMLQEDASREGDNVTFSEAAHAGQHVRKAGIDFSHGDAGPLAGTKLSAADIALIAAKNHAHVMVYRRPVIAYFATGDELVMPGETLGADQIISSNNDGLGALIEAHGGEAMDLGIAPDDKEAIRTLAAKANHADMLVTLGGASVGDHDLVRPALEADGLEIDFWRIAMRPGKPLMFGRYGEVPMLGLPGNPVSALVCAQLFLVPAILRMQGTVETQSLMIARLGADVKANDAREDYLRAKLDHVPGELPVVTPLPVQDSSMLSALSAADCLIIRPPHAEAEKAGATVSILPLR
ncbi:MAG: molybdopterin molybdenumtransferase MoeA [Rhizobiales bacterium]|nr:molybdopterin molybdenumtransferase MoeA [Hyphomicrobiales bacterium]